MKENFLKIAEMSCRLVCGVIAPNDPDKLHEALVTATEKQSSHDILTLTTVYKNAPTKNLKIQILSLYVLNYSTEELKFKVFFCSYLFYGIYFLAMLVGSVKNASLFQKFILNLIGIDLCDLSESIRCHSSLLVCLIET